MSSQRISKQNDLYLVLHNVRSAHNVGSIFRTADAVGVKKIYLTGYTPTPVDRLGRSRNDVAKTALGSQNHVAWEHFERVGTLLDGLKRKNIKILALEQSKEAVDYKSVTVRHSSALVVGNEVRGLSSNILSKVDLIIEIPMKGKKESLNVSVACGIALFRLCDV